MYRTFVRPLNDVERAQIETRLNLQPPPRPTGWWAKLRERFSGEYAFWARIYEAQVRQFPVLRKILADGHAIVHSVQPRGVVIHCQCEDEGDSSFFDIGDGRLFCICFDQDEDPDVAWPNTDFEVIESRSHPDHFQRRAYHGSALEPVRVIEPHMNVWDRLPKSSVCIIEGTLATVERDLKLRADRERGIVESDRAVAAIAPNRELRYRLASPDLIVASCCTALFLALAILSVGLLRANDDGRLPGQTQIAIMVSVFWTVPVVAGLWTIAAYFRTRLLVSADAITQRGCIRRKTILASEVTQLDWNNTSEPVSVVVHSPRAKITIELRNFARPDRDELIAYFRNAFGEEI